LTKKRALITGISGQDGAYLAQLLVGKGYEVFGTSRNHQENPFTNLHTLGIHQDVQLMSMLSADVEQVKNALEFGRPDEVYNLSCQSSVGRSVENPEETWESIVTGTQVMLDAIRESGRPTRYFNPSSSEMYGETPMPATERTVAKPVSPYGFAKAEAMRLVSGYRQQYDLFACSAVLFNHESPLRGPSFVTRKIVDGAVAILDGKQENLHLGNTDIVRDWGWAPEYVDGMWRLMQIEAPEDMVLATGTSVSLNQFVSLVFESLGLNAADHVILEKNLKRVSDIRESRGNPLRAQEKLGWQAKLTLRDIAERLVADAGADK
jgi:GDPmannose 4,6-dehydratase